MLEAGRNRPARTAMAIAVISLVLNGCALHKKAQPFLLPPFTPVELAQIPQPQDPPMIETDDDDEDLPPVPVAEGASIPKRQKRKVVKAAVQNPPPDVAPAQVSTQVASAGATPESVSDVGEFTPGGNQDPKSQQAAAELIAANEKRLNALSPDVVRTQAALVSNVRNFQKQAQQALKAGDAEGAKTLATKGKLLLEDIERAAGS